MKDHYYIDENGNRTPVSKMLLKDILEILATGEVVIVDDRGENEKSEDIIERLKIELIIRGQV